MGYWNAAVPILGVLDATDFIPLGSCHQRESGGFYWAAQRIVSRDMLDTYEYTDRTARVADCASDALARGAA